MRNFFLFTMALYGLMILFPELGLAANPLEGLGDKACEGQGHVLGIAAAVAGLVGVCVCIAAYFQWVNKTVLITVIVLCLIMVIVPATTQWAFEGATAQQVTCN